MGARILVGVAAALVAAVALLLYLIAPTQGERAVRGDVPRGADPVAFELRSPEAGPPDEPRVQPQSVESARRGVEPAPASTRTGPRMVGRLVDAAGEPLEAGRWVLEARDVAPQVVSFVAAADDGAFELELPVAGNLAAHATRDPETSARSPELYFKAQAGETVDLGLVQLSREHAIAGVVYWPDGSPAEGVMVGLYTLEPGPSSHPAVRTDRAGSFRFDGVPPGSYEVSISCDCEGPDEIVPVECGQIDLVRRCGSRVVEVEARDQAGRVVPIESLWVREQTEGGSFMNWRFALAPPVERFKAGVCTDGLVIHSATGVDGRTYAGAFEGPFHGTPRQVLTRYPDGLGSVRFLVAYDGLPGSAELVLEGWPWPGNGRWNPSLWSSGQVASGEPLTLVSPLLPEGTHEVQLFLRGAGLRRLDRTAYTVDVRAGEVVEFSPQVVDAGCLAVPKLDLPGAVTSAFDLGSRSESVVFVPGAPRDAASAGAAPPVRTFEIDLSRGPWSSEALLPGRYSVSFRHHRSWSQFRTEVEIHAGEVTWVEPIFDSR